MKRSTITFYIIFGVFLVFSVFFFPHSTHALTADELRNKIADQNTQIDALEKEIAAYQSQLAAIGNQKETLAQNLKEIEVTTKKLVAQQKVLQQKILLKNEDIQKLNGMIGEKGDAITTHKSAIGESIRFLSRAESEPLIVGMLRSEDISESWQAVDQLAFFQKSLQENIDQLLTDKVDLEETKTTTEKAKADLVGLKNNLTDQKKIVDTTAAQKKKLLDETKNQESTYAALLAQKIALRDAFEKETRDYESQLKYVLDPKSLPATGSAPLSWPLDTIYITQLFGKTSSSGRLYASGTHSGVDFRASVGTPVKALADGIVEGTGNTDIVCKGASWGNFVFIKYDNGLASTFGHLSLIKAVKGQRVTRGQVVAYSGNTGYSTGPHLHVSVYAKDAVELTTKPSLTCKGKTLTQPIAPINAYLDPMLYFPPYHP